ncbi:hypothetical protein BD309DRAFT_956186 [Dichomitus squalens]|uniref:Uncharacterized protein n=1 Tax=Dichomitus squalens TaxID=114155 RepID=A0A4Q9NVL0_9APHY|nr:hypothetical protein BD309DRAFT_956186 [Dichomitus squalens]TBU55509.1 hypothetical protein BD310DRAFT_933525 [Dichomitus squalens]
MRLVRHTARVRGFLTPTPRPRPGSLLRASHTPRHSAAHTLLLDPRLSIPSTAPLLHWCNITLSSCIINSLIGLRPFCFLLVLVVRSTRRCQLCSVSLLRIVITLPFLFDLTHCILHIAGSVIYGRRSA